MYIVYNIDHIPKLFNALEKKYYLLMLFNALEKNISICLYVRLIS
jgi:hypothetical protein